MPRDSDPALPRWARVSKRKAAKETVLSTDEEESYLQTQMYHAMALHVDEALQSTLEAHVSPLVEEMMSFFQQVSPKDENFIEEELPKLSADGEDVYDSMVSVFQMSPPQKYPVSLLPLVTLCGPHSFLDRLEMVRYMVTKMKQEQNKAASSSQRPPAVCWLQSAGDNSSMIRHCGTFMQEILRQCIEQEPNPTLFHRLWNKTRQSNTSFSQALLMWAQYTTTFGSIVVFIDNVECISGPLLQDFLRILAQLRAEHRLPLQIVLLTPPGQSRRLTLDSSTQGTAGIHVRGFSLPSSKLLYDSIWEKLFIDRPLPVSLSPVVLRSIHESFDHHHSSAIRSMQMLKQCLAHACMQRGSFLQGTDDSPLLEHEHMRIQYFRDHRPNVSSLEKHAREEDSRRSDLLVVTRLLHRISGYDSPSGVDWMEQNFSVSCFKLIQPFILERFSGLPKFEKLTRFVGLRREFQHTSSSQLRDLLTTLNELIVLTEEASEVEECTFAQDLSQLFAEWVYNVSAVGAAIQSQQRDAQNPFSPLGSDPSVNAVAPQVRKQLTGAMLHPPSIVNQSDCQKLAPSLIFSILQDRVVASREECFEAFANRFDGESSLEELCSAFAFGIHQLCYCGFVKEKLGSKNNVLYERTALVWCSGE